MWRGVFSACHGGTMGILPRIRLKISYEHWGLMKFMHSLISWKFHRKYFLLHPHVCWHRTYKSPTKHNPILVPPILMLCNLPQNVPLAYVWTSYWVQGSPHPHPPSQLCPTLRVIYNTNWFMEVATAHNWQKYTQLFHQPSPHIIITKSVRNYRQTFHQTSQKPRHPNQ